MAKTMAPKSPKKAKPYCFVCYSSREAHVGILIESLKIVFSASFDIRLTPSDLVSGASQRAEIMKLIEGCAFGVVSIDGLRPNVVFEYGALHAHKKPILVFKEHEALVDINSYY